MEKGCFAHKKGREIWVDATPRVRITLNTIRTTVEKQNSLIHLKPQKKRTIRKTAHKRKERHVRWYPELNYHLIRDGVSLESSPEDLYKDGKLMEHHLYHFKHNSEEAKRNMKRPKYVGVFRLKSQEALHVHGTRYYVRPQDKYLRQMYGFDKSFPHSPDESRTDRGKAWDMVCDSKTSTITPYHIDIFAIRGQRSLQNSQERRIRRRTTRGARNSIRKSIVPDT